MTVVQPGWRRLFDEVPRELFIPDLVWLRTGDTFQRLSRADDPRRWQAIVELDVPITTQLSDGGWPTSSSSQPSIMTDMLDALDVLPGHRVLEIGTGTGWNAALLCRRVTPGGQVVSVEVDPVVGEQARAALRTAGYAPITIIDDGTHGYPLAAPYDRVMSTAAVRDVVPQAWVDQLRPGGKLVTAWGTDWWNGFMLTVTKTRAERASGRFSGNLAFMRIRAQHASLYGWEPDEADITRTDATTTACRGDDLAAMLDRNQALFAIGARVPDCYRYLEWNHYGQRHHLMDLDDGRTTSFARLDWNVADPAPFTVYQLGPRRLWDEVEAAYRWWREQGEPGLDRFGLEIDTGRQWLWLDSPDTVVRELSPVS